MKKFNGVKLKNARESVGLSGPALAERMTKYFPTISRSIINYWENSAKANPTANHLFALSFILKRKTDYFFNGGVNGKSTEL